MILIFHFIILKRVNKYGIFCNYKINVKLSQNNSRELISFQRVYIGVCLSNTRLVGELVIPHFKLRLNSTFQRLVLRIKNIKKRALKR